MEEWLSVSGLSDKSEIPESTIRRYTTKFDKFFRYEKRGKGKKFHPESVEILNRISTLYKDDLQADEIEKILELDYSFSIEADSQEVSKPVKSLETQFKEFQEQQAKFNKQLLDKVDEQQKYIDESIKRRDKELTEVMKNMLESRKQIAATEEKKDKKWWQFWRN